MSPSPHSSHARAQAKLEHLLSLIQSTATEAMGIYAQSSAGVPSPDLLQPHPMDTIADAVPLKKTLRVLEGACELLCTTLAQPMHTLMNRAMAFESQCLRIAVKHGIADKLLPFPEGCHVSDLALETGLDQKKLAHVMRMLATRNCFREVYQDTFTNNRISCTLLSSNPANISKMISTFTDESQRAVSSLIDVISHPEWKSAIVPTRSAFIYSVKDEMAAAGFEVGERGTFIDWQGLHPDIRERFGQGMIGWSMLTGSGAVVTHFPWNEMPKGTTFCDIGSGPGHVALSLAKAYPHINITLQDLPGPLEQAKKLWNSKFPEGVNSGRIKFQAFDFFKEQPVANQDVYYLKHIIHMFPDDLALVILNGICDVMPDDGRVLIQEFVTQSAAEDAFKNDFGLDMAPPPLLPNYGSGSLRTYTQDVLMLSMYNAQERNISEFNLLGRKAKLKLLKAWDYGETVVLEFVKATPEEQDTPLGLEEENDNVKSWVRSPVVTTSTAGRKASMEMTRPGLEEEEEELDDYGSFLDYDHQYYSSDTEGELS